MKDSFILYQEHEEIFNELTNEEAGKLIKAIFEYERTGQIQELDKSLKIALIPIKNTLDKNREKYEKVVERNKQNIQKRWNKQDTKNTTGKNGIPKNTKNTDNDNDNDNDIIINNNKKEKPTLEEIQNYIKEKQLKVNGEQFYNYFTEGNWIDAKGNKVKNWKQKLLTWNKYQPEVKQELKKYQNYEQREYNDLSKFYANM